MKGAMMKEVAAKAMNALDGLDASNIKSVTLMFTGLGKKGQPDKEEVMDDSEEDVTEETDSEENGCKCEDCGMECEPEDKYCSECGGEVTKEGE